MIIMVNSYPFILVEFHVSITGKDNLTEGHFITKAKYSNLIFGFAEENKSTCIQIQGVQLDNCQLDLPEYIDDQREDIKVKFIELRKE